MAEKPREYLTSRVISHYILESCPTFECSAHRLLFEKHGNLCDMHFLVSCWFPLWTRLQKSCLSPVNFLEQRAGNSADAHPDTSVIGSSLFCPFWQSAVTPLSLSLVLLWECGESPRPVVPAFGTAFQYINTDSTDPARTHTNFKITWVIIVNT